MIRFKKFLRKTETNREKPEQNVEFSKTITILEHSNGLNHKTALFTTTKQYAMRTA